MKKYVFVVVLVALMAAPAFAGVVNVSPTNTVRVGDVSPRGTPIYQNLTTIGYYFNTVPYGPAGDDIHAISGGTITSFKMGYFKPTTGSFNMSVKFYGDTPTDSVIPGSSTVPAPLLATYSLTGLPGAGAWIITISGLSQVVSQDFWFEENFTGAGTAGPLLTNAPGATIGNSHDIFSLLGNSYYFGPTGGPSSGVANFVLEFDIPEPATIALLALTGLVILRRR